MAGDIEVELARLAQKQHGAFTRADATQLGFSRKMVRRRLTHGSWVELRPDVYAVSSTPRTRKLELSAASLWCGPDGALSHHTAAEHYRRDGRWGRGIHVIIPERRRLRAEPPIEVHRSRDYEPERDARTRDKLRVTTLARTLVDLSQVLLDEKWLEIALESALRDQRLDLGWMYRLIGKLDPRGHRGLPALVRLLDAREFDRQRYSSALEVLIGRMQRNHGLPEPLRPYTIVENNRRLLDADFAWPELKVAVEGDGYLFHSGRRAWVRDASVRRKLKVLGWEVIALTWSEVERDPAPVARDLATILRRRAEQLQYARAPKAE